MFLVMHEKSSKVKDEHCIEKSERGPGCELHKVAFVFVSNAIIGYGTVVVHIVDAPIAASTMMNSVVISL